MRKLVKKVPWMLGGLLLVGLLVYGFWPKAVRVDAVRVERGSFLVTIDDDGETRIREKYSIAVPVTGKLLRLNLHAGDLVERGKTELMQIVPADPTLLDTREQAESEARVRAADAAYEEAQATLATAKEITSISKSQYERALKLHQSDSISPAEYDEAEHRYRVATAGLRSAESRLKVKLYEQELAQAALTRFSDKSPTPDAVLKLVAPIDGVVLRVFQEDANLIPAGTAVLEIGDPRDLEIQIDILSNDAVAVQPGNQLIIESWGGERPLHARVRIVEPSAFLKISALGVEEKRVNVIADFIEPWEERRALGDGYRIEARIITRTTPDSSIKVASAALFRDHDAWHAYRVQAGRAQLVAIDVGDSNGLESQILEGLEEGDLVILHPSSDIEDGLRVTPIQ